MTKSDVRSTSVDNGHDVIEPVAGPGPRADDDDAPAPHAARPEHAGTPG